MANGLSFGEVYRERFKLGLSEYGGQQYLVSLARCRGGIVENREVKAVRGG